MTIELNMRGRLMKHIIMSNLNSKLEFEKQLEHQDSEVTNKPIIVQQ